MMIDVFSKGPFGLTRKNNSSIREMFDFPISFFESYFDASQNRSDADLREDDKSYTLKIDVPGINPEDIDLNYDSSSGTLTVKASRNDDGEKCEQDYRIRERRYGSICRAFILPMADEKSIEAKINNGVLHVTAMKSNKCERKKIKISCE